MASCVSSEGHKNIKLALLIGILNVFFTKQFTAKFKPSLLIVRKFLSWVVQSETTPLRKIVEARRPKLGGAKMEILFRHSQSRIPAFAVREHGTSPSDFPGVDCGTHVCSQRSARAIVLLSAVLGKKLSPPFLSGSTFLQSILARKNASAKLVPPKKDFYHEKSFPFLSWSRAFK